MLAPSRPGLRWFWCCSPSGYSPAPTHKIELIRYQITANATNHAFAWYRYPIPSQVGWFLSLVPVPRTSEIYAKKNSKKKFLKHFLMVPSQLAFKLQSHTNVHQHTSTVQYDRKIYILKYGIFGVFKAERFKNLIWELVVDYKLTWISPIL